MYIREIVHLIACWSVLVYAHDFFEVAVIDATKEHSSPREDSLPRALCRCSSLEYEDLDVLM